MATTTIDNVLASKAALHIILIASFVLRLVLVAYGSWQDVNFAVKYTDVDYEVFTDAAALVHAGQSPYRRSTYRYTPLLAWLLLPNVMLHKCFGKVLFSAADIGVGWLTYRMCVTLRCSRRVAAIAALMWLFNPYTLTISTRGNGDALVVLGVLGMLSMLLHGRPGMAGFLQGVLVHWRVFPMIYTPAVLAFLTAGYAAALYGPPKSKHGVGTAWWSSRVNAASIRFAAAASASFMLLGVLCYACYGMEFLQHAFLYHLSRKDPRHNFSIFFLPTYLMGYGPGAPPAAAIDPGIVAFPVLVVLQVAIAARLHGELPLCMLLQTLAFVAFNKVCTAQYFVWYFGLLPVVMACCGMAPPRPVAIAWLAWLGAQLNWLAWAYLLEFKGRAVYGGVWVASATMLAAHVCVMRQLLLHCRSPISFHAACVRALCRKSQ